jgi:PII-like signaling protein
MKIEGPGKWLRIYVGEADHWHGKPLYQAIVELLRREGLAGATVFRGVEGFGAHSRVHTARVLRMSEDLPFVVEVIDQAERIERVLPMLDEMVGDGLMMLIDVNVVLYRTNRAETE